MVLMLLQKDEGVASKSIFVSQGEATKKLEEFFRNRLVAIVQDYVSGGTIPSVREITDKLDETRLEDFRSWLKASLGDGPAARYADAARQTKGRRQSLFQQVGQALEDQFIASPGNFIKSSEYAPDAQAAVLKEPLSESYSNQRALEHYADLEREYRADWVAIPDVIILQGIITLGLDMVALGKKDNRPDDEIDKMLGFLPAAAKPAIFALYTAGVELDALEGQIAQQGGTVTDSQKAELAAKRDALKTASITARDALRSEAKGMAGGRFRPIGNAWDLLSRSQIKAYLVNMKNKDGEYLFDDLRVNLPAKTRSKYGISAYGTGGSDVPEKECTLAIPSDWLNDHSKRLDGLGAKLTAWFNHNLALQSKNIIRAFVLEPIFSDVSKGGSSNEPWANLIHDILMDTKSKEFASGSASHEPPPSPELIKRNWYADMVDANRNLDTNLFYFGVKTAPQRPEIENYLADGVDYLAVMDPDMMDSMAKAIEAEAARRGPGKFYDEAQNLLNSILASEGGKYRLDDSFEKRMAYMDWIDRRKPDKSNRDFEDPDHPASWYLNLKNIRFTGTGSDVPTRLKVHVEPLKEHVANTDKAVVDVTVTLMSGGKEDQDLITPGVPVSAPADSSAPIGTLKGLLFRSDNGEFIQDIDGPIGMPGLPAQANRTESIVGIDREPQAGVEGTNPKIERVYTFSVTTGAEDKYYAYYYYQYGKADGSFKIQAGVDPKDYISEEMQRSNAGTAVTRFTPQDYKITVRKHAPEDVDWDHVDFGPVAQYITAGTVTFRSQVVKAVNVPVTNPDGSPVIGENGQPVVKSEAVIMPNPLEAGSRGVFTVKLGDLQVPAEFFRRNLVIPVEDTDASGNTLRRYQLLEELPASNMPVGVMGIGMYSEVVDYATGSVTDKDGNSPFRLIPSSGRPVPVAVEAGADGKLADGSHWFEKRLIYAGQTAAFVTYHTKIDPATHEEVAAPEATEYRFNEKFIQRVMSGEEASFRKLKDMFVTPVTLDAGGAAPPIKLNWSGNGFIGVALDAEEWAKADVQAKSYLSYITPWDVQIEGEGGKPGKTVPLTVREGPGSSATDPKLILSYQLKDEATGAVKNVDVYRAYKENGGWMCAPIQEFDSGGNIQGGYKLFLEAIGALPKPEEKKDSGELRGGGIRRLVPRRARHG